MCRRKEPALTAALFLEQREIEQSYAAPPHLAQKDARLCLANLVAHLAREQRGLRIIDDERLLAVQPARAPIDTSANRLHAKRAYAIDDRALASRRRSPAERLSLPQ